MKLLLLIFQIQNEWTEKNVRNYKKGEAPAILLKSESGEAHAKISAAQRARRAQLGGYNTTIKQEFNISYREMIEAGVSKKDVKNAMKKAYKYFDDIEAFD